MARQINQAGIDLIKHFESLQLQAYQDSVGIWTIGYGHTAGGKNDGSIHAGMAIDEQQAEDFLRQDLAGFEQAVDGAVATSINDNQFAALISFSFNLGAANLRSSTLLRVLNEADHFAAAGEFKQWSKAGGKRLAGLVRRRISERNLFCSFPDPVVESLPDNWEEVYEQL
jgi:lysozyme